MLLVIDVQNSFVNKKTNHIIKKISNLIDTDEYEKIIFTRFVNSKNSNWYKKLNYTDCIDEVDKGIPIDTGNHLVIDKTIYSALNKKIVDIIKKDEINEIYLCGIDTECCVLKTALDFFENGYDVYVLKNYCASTRGKIRHNNALKIIARCIGYDKVI